MSRRLLGYVVKMPDGTRSPLTPRPIRLDPAGNVWDRSTSDTGYYVVPVFAVRKPKLASAEGRYAVRHRDRCDGFDNDRILDLETRQGVFAHRYVGTRDEAVSRLSSVSRGKGTLVRVLDDGAYEAAVAAAYAEGAAALEELEREHEAAVAAAVERGREQGFGAAQALARSTANALRVESRLGALAVVKVLEEVAKGQDK